MKTPTEPPAHYSAAKIETVVAEILDLPAPNRQSQDWGLVVAGSARVEEFLTVYERHGTLADDEKFTIMEVILASFDDQVRAGGQVYPVGRRVRKILGSEFGLIIRSEMGNRP